MRQVLDMPKITGVLFLLALPILAACSSASVPDRYYLLSAMPTAGNATAASGVVGVGPVTIPSHLDRSTIVSRSSQNRLVLNGGHRWAEPFDENITRVLVDNLDRLASPERVETYPWTSRDGVTWQVAVDIDRFEQQPDGTVMLSARWKLVDFARGKVLLSQRFEKRARPGTPGVEGTVATMSDLLAALAQTIAVNIP